MFYGCVDVSLLCFPGVWICPLCEAGRGGRYETDPSSTHSTLPHVKRKPGRPRGSGLKRRDKHRAIIGPER